jgi:hypothetical protein
MIIFEPSGFLVSFKSSKKCFTLSSEESKMIGIRSKWRLKMSLERYKTNPFLEGMLIPMKGRQVKLSKLGKDNNVLVNQSTGEIRGTHITTYKQVDGDQFIKLFTANIALTFDLSSAGIKTLGFLLWVVQQKAISKDEVVLDSMMLGEFLAAQNKSLLLSIATFKRGLNELEKAQIIAKTMRKSFYFINPNFVFNGDRIAFTTLIERKTIKNGDPNQITEST